MTTEGALGIAARCWTDEDTSHIEMITALAEAFAKRIDTHLNMLEVAWGIIANAGGGNWELESETWNDAAVRWRERYHALLKDMS